MIALPNFSVENVNSNRIRVVVRSYSSQSSKTVTFVDGDFPNYVVYLVFLVSLPLFFVFLLFLFSGMLIVQPLKSLTDWLFPNSVTYEDADQWFKERKGYLQNLSEDEKEKLFSKDENLPLGL
ncbi:MAG: hypothetical protein J7647_24505 [Cyanobacteria bacterium SBLK]|nr:hypothetical protein [Cyanobacteria bacterium SBLK]